MPFVIVLSIVPFAWALRWHARHTVEVAAEQCVDALQAWNGGDGGSAARAITNQAGNMDAGSVSVQQSDGAVQVSCTVTGTPRFSLFINGPVTATASGPKERFTSP